MASGTGAGEWQGNLMSTGVSDAYRYINISNVSFNATNGNTTFTLKIGTWVSRGNFYGSIVSGGGYFGDESYAVYDASGNPYGWHQTTMTVAYNSSVNFYEWCGYTSASAGWISSEVWLTWTPTLPTYTVSYNANGGSGAPSSQSKKWGSTLTLSNAVPTRTGYTFNGWNTKADGTGTNYAKGASYTANASTTLYAKWTLNSWTVSYNANGGSGSVSNQTKYYGQALTLASSGYTRSYYTLDGWATSASGSKAYDLGASYTGNAALSLYAYWKINTPGAPSGVSASRNSDTSASVSWTRATGADTTYQRIYVERQTDGGAWAELTYVAGTATSYTDTTISANHTYSYRVRAYNSSGYSSYGTSGAIYTTPAAPANVTGERSGNGTSVVLTVSNDNTRTATGFDVQYRAEGSDTWTNATVASSTGTPVTSITIDNMGGSFYFRVRNTRTSPALESAWTESALVVTITPPNAPTLVSPSSGAVLGASSSTQSVTFEWQHNPVDGSSQTAAEIRYRKSTTQTWTTATATTSESKAITLDRGYSYVWQVRTKGADANYGDWSNTQSFDLYAPPSITVDFSPKDGSGNLEGMPLQYTVAYTDDYGLFASGTISISLGGTVLYSETLPTTATTIGTASNITGEVTTQEFLPSSGNTYTLDVTVRSSDTLTATATKSMPVSMGEPYHGTLTITNDPDTGYASLTVGWDENTGSVAATYATVYRVTADGRKLLGDNLQQGAGILDKYAPLNTTYQYEVITHASSTAIAVEDFDNVIETQRWFAYWGNECAWAEWNPQGSYKLTRPDKKRVHYVGREYPVSYDGTALDEEHSIQWTVLEMHEWSNGFIKLMHDGGRGIYKSVDGKVFRADFELTNTPNYTSITKIGTVSLQIVRIDGDLL